MRILLKKVHCIEPRSRLNGIKDVLIERGVIREIGSNIAGDADEVIEGKSLTVFPGFLDVHVHLRDPGYEHKETIETGIQAALNGGIAGMVPMPNTNPACDNRSVVEYILSKAKALQYSLFPCGAQSKGRLGKEISEMAELKRAGVCAFSDDGSCITDSLLMRRVMEYAAMVDLPLMIHAEDHRLSNHGVMHEGAQSTKLGLRGISDLSESLIVMRDLEFSRLSGAHVHFAHLSTAKAVDLVRQSKKSGLRVTCEVTPHHFSQTDAYLESYDPNFKMYPPLRSEEDRLAILQGIKDGTIDMIATDHAPHLPIEKDVDMDHAPFGCIGLETAVGVTLTELHHKEGLSLEQIAVLWNLNPARLVRAPDFGAIAVGNVANLTVVNTEESWVVDPLKFKTKSRNTTFAGMKLKGKPVMTIYQGKTYRSCL